MSPLSYSLSGTGPCMPGWQAGRPRGTPSLRQAGGVPDPISSRQELRLDLTVRQTCDCRRLPGWTLSWLVQAAPQLPAACLPNLLQTDEIPRGWGGGFEVKGQERVVFIQTGSAHLSQSLLH